jgi:hypothetical protein
MQTTSARYDQLASGNVRPLSWQYRMSWDKSFDDDVTFFTLDTSLLNGTDVLAPSDDNPIQEWDKYKYQSYSDRIISMEWSRQEEVPYSVNLAIADITLNNYDNYFTYGAGSPLEPNILPGRPMRILAGFGNENIPQFVGLTQKTPIVEYQNGRATLHAMDFLSYIMGKSIDKTTMFENITTTDLLTELFTIVGLTPSQYVLDTSTNVIAFTYFDKGTTFGDAIKPIMQAEMGSLYMDEVGVIRFENRTRGSGLSMISFNKDNIVNFKVSNEDTIINTVEVKSAIREVQPTELIFDLSEAIEISGNSSKVIFFDLQDPVTTIQPIENFTANSLADGSGTDRKSSITVTDTDLFTTAIRVELTNSNSSKVYVTDLLIYGTPAKVTKNIFIRESNQDSIDKFEEHIMTIDNNFVQTEDIARSLALTIINYYKDYTNTIELEVKGNHALQINDLISVAVDNINADYRITKITNIMQGSQFIQRLTGKIYNIADFFILSSDVTAKSLLDGPDVLAP